jgi:WD40 repeat protein
MIYREHSGTVNAVAWSPDGNHIASGCNQTVQVWTAVTGALFVTYQWHSSWKDQGGDDPLAALWYDSVVVKAIAWSPDGSRIVSGYYPYLDPTEEGLLQIWDVTTGTRVFTYPGYTFGIEAVTWSPDGSCNASGFGGLVHVRGALTKTMTATSQDHFSRVSLVVWSPDCKRIACSSNQSVQVRDAVTGTQLVEYQGHIGKVSTIAWSPDGNFITSGSWDWDRACI